MPPANPTESPDAAEQPNAAEQRLIGVLERAQAEGALGAWPIPDVVAHAREFVLALPQEATTVLDLGSGAGIPGLVIALDRPMAHLTLVDRRAKRVDALRRAVTALGWTARVRAVEADADSLASQPEWDGSQDAVVARGFGPPEVTLAVAARLARVGGWVIISEPPADQPSRWDPALLRQVGVGDPERHGRVVRFHVERSPDPAHPWGTVRG